ncbi:MAG: hypothetical protein ACRD9W_30135 [Terriglobia bacterium]
MSSRKISVAIAAFAVLALTVSGADAGKRKQIDPAIDGTAFWAGVGTTAAGLGFRNLAAGAGISGVACVLVSPMAAMIVTRRALKNREANYMFASCVVPVVGGWLMNAVYDNGWLTPPDEVSKVHHRRKKAAAR